MTTSPDTTPARVAPVAPAQAAPAEDASASPLGQVAAYRDQYDPSLLFPITRDTKRAELGLGGTLPFLGCDLWTAYELSWLNPRGKPQIALATITVPCESPAIIESKSFKLYLNSFNMSRFESADVVRDRLVADLSAACGLRVGVRLVLPEQFEAQRVIELEGTSLDRLDLDCDQYEPDPGLLGVDTSQADTEETLHSRLLKSNCLVTGQPDWGSVQIRYSGAPIDHAGLLRYLVSFRNHNEFHEQCVERIYTDIMARCHPVRLMVYARYTRRGGLDINPWRSSHPEMVPANVRTARQ
ncbi:7-cyano-7-deazaguanine reductase [Sphaerotilus hippei]|uniref:NADPH-dependent 7-cyano-7-deazaguanine reductase n=1 Tax=Sphaerotilus hippei TaxID=744406 RepID=A0A318HB42_9BURK|nr:NADPH-dependent 7-cyano-7-deazaguanine reductase QueF [Sphaerotilus hippei]PXW97919.1 7-cyano-7-deazaguanine reductase [Sphaerotilus hippei]